MSDFEEFPKIARLSRNCVITEKIDGTNAQVLVKALEGFPEPDPACIWQADGLALFAGSRNRWITPSADNFGFARWVLEHAEELAGLGEGRHFGEWWGSGIQRGYGLQKGEKRFSLFNTARWASPESVLPVCCSVVPVLYSGPFGTDTVDVAIDALKASGSRAAPGFIGPEGVVVYHAASRTMFKKTIEKDEEPKGFRS